MEPFLQREARRVVTPEQARANFMLVKSGGLKASVWASLVATVAMGVYSFVTRL